MKRVSWFSIGGAVLGSALASWLAPKMIAWYFDPPVNIGINCRPATEWAMAKLQVMQFIGLIAGLALGLTLALVTRKREDGVPSEPMV